MREAQLLQGAVDRIIGHRDSELLMQLHDQIARPPAHHAVDCRDRTGLDDVGEERLVLGAELAGRARRRLADEAFGPLFVEPYHPVPQRLAVHAASLAASARDAPSSNAANANSPRVWATTSPRLA